MSLSYTNLTSWLYKTYINLESPVEGGAFHPYGIEFAYASLVENQPLPRIQSILMPSFRDALYRRIGIETGFCHDPLRLPDEWQTDRWRNLTGYLRDFTLLSLQEQVNVSWLLVKM